MKTITRLAVIFSGSVLTLIAAPAIAELGTFIRFGQVEVERVCNYYTNNREAFDDCVSLNLESGVEVHYTENSERGPSYATNWDFCPINTLTYALESPLSNQDGYVQPCS